MYENAVGTRLANELDNHGGRSLDLNGQASPGCPANRGYHLGVVHRQLPVLVTERVVHLRGRRSDRRIHAREINDASFPPVSPDRTRRRPIETEQLRQAELLAP